MSDAKQVALSDVALGSGGSRVNDASLRAMLVQRAWVYNPEDGSPSWGRIRFLEDGRIGEYESRDAQLWSVANNTLTFTNVRGEPTSRFILVFGEPKPMLAGKTVGHPQRRVRLDYTEA